MATATNPKILIVDDEEMLRKAMAFDFKRKGFEVFEAPSGRTAIAIVNQSPIDVIISDIRMPDGDGLSLLTQVKNKNLEKPVVFLMTGFADISVEDAYQLGADAIFNKPFDRHQVMKAVLERLQPELSKWRYKDADFLAKSFSIELTLTNLIESQQAQILNLGRGGFFVSYNQSLPEVGALVQFKMDFSDEAFAHINGSGVVRWVRHTPAASLPRGFGVEFSQMDSSTRIQIIELIARLNQKAFIPKV